MRERSPTQQCCDGTCAGADTCEDAEGCSDHLDCTQGYACNTSKNTCAAACGDSDFLCIGSYHCDDDTCVADLDLATTCDEDSDCTSASCESAVCCPQGADCCQANDDCSGDAPPGMW